MTLHLEGGDNDWSGSTEVLGHRYTLEAVVGTDEGVRATLVSGSDRIALHVGRTEDRLTGTLIRRNERFPLELARVPRYPPPAGRAEEWLQDLDALSERFLAADRSFTPAERSLFLEHIRDLRDQLPELNDSEILMRMATAVALAGNAHTRLYLLRNRTELRRLPIRLWWFSDGVYVVRATRRQQDLLGCRVDAIEGMPMRLVRDRVAAAFAGNPSWTDYKSVYYMTSPKALHGFGIAPDPERVEFSFSACAPGGFDRALVPLPLVRTQSPVEAWRDLSPRHPDGEWVQILESSSAAPPLYLRHPDRHYWFEYLDPGLLYFQFNRASEMDEVDLGEFSERLLAAFENSEVERFVLDLRFNTGGDLRLARELMIELQDRTKGMPRFVITGRATFSAGMTEAAYWKQAGDVTLVGEPVGDDLDFWAEGGNIILPNSRLAAHFANAFHSYSEMPCPQEVPCFLDLSSPDLRPDIPVSSTWVEYAAGVDVALEAVRAAMK